MIYCYFKKYKTQPIHYNVAATQSSAVLCLKDKVLGKQKLTHLFFLFDVVTV